MLFRSVGIEVDERQHSDERNYSCSCEEKRLIKILNDLKKPIIFIRFNPDAYNTVSGDRIGSCWGYNKKKEAVVKKRGEWASRLKALQEQVSYWIDTPPGKSIEQIHLFYDGFA